MKGVAWYSELANECSRVHFQIGILEFVRNVKQQNIKHFAASCSKRVKVFLSVQSNKKKLKSVIFMFAAIYCALDLCIS